MTGTLRTAFVAMLVIVLAAAGAFAYYTLTDTPFPWQSTEPPSRYLLIVAAPDDAQAVIAQVIVLVDTQEGSITGIAPDTQATIAGTSYNELKDAFPFGGGAAVAEAYSEATGTRQLPYIVIPAEVLSQTIADAGGATLTIPAGMDVFDGETLYNFTAGTSSLTGAEFMAVLKGRPYLSPTQQRSLDQSLAQTVAVTVGRTPDNLQTALKTGSAETDIMSDTAITLVESLGDLVP